MEPRVSSTSRQMSVGACLLRLLTRHFSARFTSVNTARLPGPRTLRFAPIRRTRRSLQSQPGPHMPEVSRFYGIVVRFYYRDHPPTHFHAIYGEHEALIEIESGAIYRGGLP